MKFTGNDLKRLGFEPGPRFGMILKEINASAIDGRLDDATVSDIITKHREAIEEEESARLERMKPMLEEKDAVDVIYNIDSDTPEEMSNLKAVAAAMETLKLTPTVVGAVVMPDACPAGPIPVGGVVGAKSAIHPGWRRKPFRICWPVGNYRRYLASDSPRITRLWGTALQNWDGSRKQVSRGNLSRVG